MHVFDPADLASLLASYGSYAVFLIVMLESAGLPVPGETILVSAAVYTGTGRGLDIRFVIVAAAAGAIMGDNIGFWVGRSFGQRALARLGPRIGLDERKQKLGRYLFGRFGGAIVFFGRFVALLRTYSALLAGINGLSPRIFFVCNAAGGIVWALVFGIGGHLVGRGVEKVSGPVGIIGLVAGLIGAVVGWRVYKRHEDRLFAHVEREMARDEPPPPERA